MSGPIVWLACHSEQSPNISHQSSLFQLTAPDGKVLYTQEKKTDDSYFFTADQDGKYIFCLANQKSSLVPKLVYFMFDFLNDEKRYNEEDTNNNKTGKILKGFLVLKQHSNLGILNFFY